MNFKERRRRLLEPLAGVIAPYSLCCKCGDVVEPVLDEDGNDVEVAWGRWARPGLLVHCPPCQIQMVAVFMATSGSEGLTAVTVPYRSAGGRDNTRGPENPPCPGAA